MSDKQHNYSGQPDDLESSPSNVPEHPPQRPGCVPQPAFDQPQPIYAHIQPGFGHKGKPERYEPEVWGVEFNDENIRKRFIRKVYSILMCQWSASLPFIAFCMFQKDTNNWLENHPAIFCIALPLLVIIMVLIGCCINARRTCPMNIICLVLLTLGQIFLLAMTASIRIAGIVMYGVCFFLAICLGVILFTFQTKWTFTLKHDIIFVAGLNLLVFSIVNALVPERTTKILWAFVGSLLFSVYFIFVTQRMMRGKHQYAISPWEYISAALNLYTDIFHICKCFICCYC